MDWRYYIIVVIACAICLPSVARAQNTPKEDIEKTVESAKKALKNGDLKVAEQLFAEALTMAESEEDLVKQYYILGNLVDLYAKKHDPQKGIEALANKAVVGNKLPGADFELMLIESVNMPLFVAEMGSKDMTKDCLEIIEAFAERANTDFGYGMYQMTKGRTLIKFKEWAEATECLFSAYDYFTESDSEYSDFFYEETLELIASCYAQLGEFKESLDVYDIVFDLIKTTKGTINTDFAKTLGFAANIMALSGDIDGGANQYIQAWNVLKSAVLRDLNALKSSERGHLWDDVQYLIWQMASFGLAGNQQQNPFTSAGYEALMFGKGFLLSAERSTEDQVLSTNDRNLIKDYYELYGLKSEIDELIKGKMIRDMAVKYARMDSLDHSITARLLSFGFEPVVKSVSARDIADGLSTGEAVVDFTNFKGTSSDTQYYAAYIMRKEYEHPHLVLVCTESDIREILDDASGRYSSLCNKRLSPKIKSKIWDPIMPYLTGVDNVYFVPSGILYNIPVESIQMEDGTTLGEKYNIKRLTSSKEVINSAPTIKNPHSAILYGGLEYDVEPDRMASAAKLTPLGNLFAMRGGIDEIRGDSIFRKLKHSEAEVIEIDSLLAQSNVKTKLLMKANGTEESFMSMHGDSPDLLLLSTHGFYYSPNNVPSWSSLHGYDNVMHLTGLVMSGGNAEWMGSQIPEGVCGGLLTSDDISKVDLSKTQIVVLSACETGLGQTTNEGVYGLQRAFKKAGAQTLIMSLWPVSDAQTKEFMVEFHRELTINQWDKRKSFVNAQITIRQKYNDPYYWASFVMID